jgi:adenylate kinase family enzyme
LIVKELDTTKMERNKANTRADEAEKKKDEAEKLHENRINEYEQKILSIKDLYTGLSNYESIEKEKKKIQRDF